jgi:glycosyltransferase involved in cell wall biosynthesis
VRVLIFEPRHVGHRLEFVRYILVGLREMGLRGILATSPAGLASREFHMHLGTEISQHEQYGLSLEPSRFATVRSSMTLAKVLKQLGGELRPDHILAPSGDGLAQALGILAITGRLGVLKRIPMQTLLLRGHYGYPCGWNTQLRQRLWLRTIEATPWKKIFHLDPYQWDYIQRTRHERSAIRWNLMPDPVSPPVSHDKSACRSHFGLDNNDIIMSCAGRLDAEKGIPDLVHAFVTAIPRLSQEVKLVLAGECSDEVRALLHRGYQAELKSGRLILLDRILESRELDDLFIATDIICAPHRRAYQSSGIVLRGVAARRPILASREGWIGKSVQHFGVGWTTDTGNANDFAAAMIQAVREYREISFSEAAQRWIQFNSPQNFSASWLEAILHQAHIKSVRNPLRWDWVVG